MVQVWKVITKLQTSGEYIACVDSWVEFVLKCFGHRELNTVLGDVIKVCCLLSLMLYWSL